MTFAATKIGARNRVEADARKAPEPVQLQRVVPLRQARAEHKLTARGSQRAKPQTQRLPFRSRIPSQPATPLPLSATHPFSPGILHQSPAHSGLRTRRCI